MTTALTVYGSSVAATTVSTACKLATTTGGVETSKTTTAPNNSTQFYMEVLSQGGSGTTNSSIPSPTGNGWLLDSTLLENQTILAGNWSVTIRSNDTGGFASIDFIARFYKRSSGGTYTSIGSITLASQSMSSTTTQYNLPATSMPQTSFAVGDKLYIDFFLHPQSSDGHWTGDPIVNFVSNSGTAGVANDFVIVTPGYNSPVNKDITVRGKISATTNKDITVRSKISAATKHDITVRGNIGNPAKKDVTTRAVISGTIYHDITVRGKIGSQRVYKDITVRGNISTKIFKDITVRGNVASRTNKDITTRGKVGAPASKDITLRGNIIARNSSGGFTLWANGTGTVTFDHFRCTEFPDPSLSLAPVLPRIGNTHSDYALVLPNNTTFEEDISYDGVNWSNVTISGGTTFPNIYSQPLPVIDSFSTNSSSNYTSTFQTGGSIATWTFDTINSRVISSGGSNAVLLNSSINRTDIDIFIDLDYSDSGGIVFNRIDANNFYLFQVTDKISSLGNNFTLYKIASNVKSTLANGSISYMLGAPQDQYTVSFARNTYHRFRITVSKGTISYSVDGTLKGSYTDPNPLGSGLVGLFSNGGTNRFYNLWIQTLGDYVTGTPAGDIVTSTFVYQRQQLSTTDPTVSPQVLNTVLSGSTPAIQFGLQVPATSYQSTFISKNIDQLAKISNYYWYIDQNKTLYFQAYNSVPSPWILQSAPSGTLNIVDLDISGVGHAGSSTSSVVKAGNFELDVGNNLYRNRQTITGAVDTSSTRTEIFVGDGSTRTFPVFLPIYQTPTITVNGIAQTVGKVNTGTFQWYWNFNDPHVNQDVSQNVLTTGDELSIVYIGLVPVLVVVDDTVAQAALAIIEGGSGIVEDVEDHSNDDPPMLKTTALARASALISRYKVSGRTLVFDTSRNGLAIGQVLTIFLPEHGILDGQFYITEIEIAMQKGLSDNQVYWYKVTCSEMPKQASWAKILSSGLQLQTNWTAT